MPSKKKRTVKRKASKRVKKTAKKTVKKPAKKSLKRKPAKKISKKAPAKKKKTAARKKAENILGIVTHYFPHVRAAVIKLKQPLVSGESIKIKGHTTDFSQTVTSMQIDRTPINSGKKGDEIGLEVISRVRKQDKVYKV